MGNSFNIVHAIGFQNCIFIVKGTEDEQLYHGHFSFSLP